MRRKRRFYKILLTIVFLIMIIVPYLNWMGKSKTNVEFLKISSNITTLRNGETDLIYSYCDTVNSFIQKNPLRNIDCLKCENYDNTTDDNFIAKIDEIRSDYRKQERVANVRMFIIQLLSLIFLGVGRKFINTRYKDENIS